MSKANAAAPAVAGAVVGDSPVRIWALTSAERLRRQFARFGAVENEAPAPRVALLRADWVYDDAIVGGLVGSPGDVALIEPGGTCVGVSVPAARRFEAAGALASGEVPSLVPTVPATEIGSSYNDRLRKREAPYLMRLTADALPAIEKRVFGGAYKGVTDIVTLYAWPAPARIVTRWCAHLGITPNQVTSASLVLVLLTMWLFWTGHFGWGLAAAWPMTFLDTVDGKLARVTVNSSKFGNAFDHGIDLIHPPFWWWAWVVGLPVAGFHADVSWALTAILVVYLLQRLEEGLFIALFKMEMHVWTWFDSKFRLITARRNPNLLILTASVLLGRPDLGILAVAWWVLFCFVLHAVRILQAGIARRRGPLQSWLQA